jgi:hypothetical protein
MRYSYIVGIQRLNQDLLANTLCLNLTPNKKAMENKRGEDTN